MAEWVRIAASEKKDFVFRKSSIQYWIEDYPHLKIFLTDRGIVDISIWNEDYFANAIESLRQDVSRL